MQKKNNITKKEWENLLPDESIDLCEEHYGEFFRTMYERMLVWKRRFIEKKPAPWTDDTILRNYKFTNVYRELDRSSQWQIEHIMLDDVLTLKNLVWKLMFYRLFNSPETFSFDGKTKDGQKKIFTDENKLLKSSQWRNGIPDYDKFDADEWAEFIQGLRDCGYNPFTNAYLINSNAAGAGNSRDYCYTRIVLPELHSKIDTIIRTVFTAKRPEEIIEMFKTIPCVADFIAHEFYQDFTYITKYTAWKRFMRFTSDDFTNVGPGASVGIRLIYPSLKDKKSGIYMLRDVAESMLKTVSCNLGDGGKVPYVYWNGAGYYINEDECNITLHQIEMWLCEYQKYFKMKVGSGKQRSMFVPHK